MFVKTCKTISLKRVNFILYNHTSINDVKNKNPKRININKSISRYMMMKLENAKDGEDFKSNQSFTNSFK